MRRLMTFVRLCIAQLDLSSIVSSSYEMQERETASSLFVVPNYFVNKLFHVTNAALKSDYMNDLAIKFPRICQFSVETEKYAGKRLTITSAFSENEIGDLVLSLDRALYHNS